MRALTAVVWVRRMFFWASSIFQSYLYLEGDRSVRRLWLGSWNGADSRSRLTLETRSPPLSGPSSPSPGSPEGTRGQVLGLRNDNDGDWPGRNERAGARVVHRITWQEEGVVLVPGGVLLRLEEGVEVPEGAFYEVICGHLTKTVDRREFESWASIDLLLFPSQPAAHPISRKICLNCVRTFISGCRWPQSGATPMASKL